MRKSCTNVSMGSLTDNSVNISVEKPGVKGNDIQRTNISDFSPLYQTEGVVTLKVFHTCKQSIHFETFK